MAFPTSPINGQSTTINGITYTYNTSTYSWKRTFNVVGATAGTTSSTGAITLNGNQQLGAANTYNSGSLTMPWANVYSTNFIGKATSAQYADLAENYAADADYEAGTVLSIAGSAEVSISTVDNDSAVIGIVTTEPAHLMNSHLASEHVAAIALAGRVPCKVTGPIKRGQFLVSNGDGTARAELNPQYGRVVGKALQDFDGTTGVIEVFVAK